MHADAVALAWVERFRPRRVADCILPPRIKELLQEQVDTGYIQNVTLIGPPGVGKTTAAIAMCEETNSDYIIINASSDNGIDVIRNQVTTFGSALSMFSERRKMIIMDEADSLSPMAQRALRGVIEELIVNCGFIFTGNFANKMLDAIDSRAPMIDFTLQKGERGELFGEMCERLIGIMRDDGIEFDEDQVPLLVKSYFPDFRKTLNQAQRAIRKNVFRLALGNAVSEEAIKQLFKFLKAGDFGKMRKWVVDQQSSDGSAMRRMLYDSAMDYVDPSSVPQFVLLLAQYDYKEGFATDREINTVAMLTELMTECEYK